MNIEDTLKLAIKLHNDDDLEAARRLYDKILKQDANHPDANHDHPKALQLCFSPSLTLSTLE